MQGLKVYVYGAGKAGRCLAKALRQRGVDVRVRPAHRGLPRRIQADVLILAVRDPDIHATASAFASAGLVPPGAVVFHLAGACGPQELAPVRPLCRGVAQMHPLVAFASAVKCPDLRGASLHVAGDREAVRVARVLAKILGMFARTFPKLDLVAYHAAAGLVAAGAVALANAAVQILGSSGVERSTSARMLGPLLRSVGDNVGRLGLPEALTGPVRRADRQRVEAQCRAIAREAPEFLALFWEVLRVQMPMARILGEGSSKELERIARLLTRGGR